jgi:hypothetical protein
MQTLRYSITLRTFRPDVRSKEPRSAAGELG